MKKQKRKASTLNHSLILLVSEISFSLTMKEKQWRAGALNTRADENALGLAEENGAV